MNTSKVVHVIQDEKLSKGHDKRFVVINAETGEVIDDAQGYGYKTAQRAYAAYEYKHRDKSKDAEKAKKKKIIRAWMKEHKDFMDLMEEIAFEVAKGSGNPNEKIDSNLVKKMFKEYDLHPNFTACDLLKEWTKG